MRSLMADQESKRMKWLRNSHYDPVKLDGRSYFAVKYIIIGTEDSIIGKSYIVLASIFTYKCNEGFTSNQNCSHSLHLDRRD